MTPEDCAELLENAPVDAESVTYVLVTGAYAGEVATALGADLGEPALTWGEDEVTGDGDASAYALAELADGVVVVEPSGYAGPSLDVLRRLSQGGRTVAVARSNGDGAVRFGHAHDGEVVVDTDEDDDDLAATLARATEATGLLVTAESLERAVAGGFYPVPGLGYTPEG